MRRFAAFLDREPKPFECLSARGYLTVTGRYEGVPVSLIAIGMGECCGVEDGGELIR